MNVLMIAIDDMNNWVGCMGGPAKTPNIDKLAEQGRLFSNAYCVVPACNPSRVALLSGLRPETTGQFGNEGDFRQRPGGDGIVVLPQYFRNNGYEAVAAGKIFHKPRGTGNKPHPHSDPKSWDAQYRGRTGTGGHSNYLNEDGFAEWHDGKFTDYLGKFGVWGPCPEPKEKTGDWMAADYIADYLKQDHEKPFFAACGIFRPHEPLLAPKEYFDRFPLEEIKLPNCPADDMDDIPAVAQKNFSSDFFTEGVQAMGEWKKAVQAYLACMAFADDCVGHVLQALENSDYADNTIVVLWTDHGWQLGHKNRWEKFSLWKQGSNAPLIFAMPGLPKRGMASDASVSFLDIYPTLIDLCDLPKRKVLEGNSLMPLLQDPSNDWNYPAIVTDTQRADRSVVYKHWNYIRYYNGDEELYDHSKDPDEFTNLAHNPEYSAVKKKLAAMLPTREQYPDWRTHEEERERNKKMK